MGSGGGSTSEELHRLYRSPNIARKISSRKLRWTGHVPRKEEGRTAIKMLTCKPTGKRPIGMLRPRQEENIRIDIMEISINTIQLRIGIIREAF